MFCLIETFLKDDQTLNINNFNSICINRTGKKGGGVAIAIHKDLKYECLNIKYSNFIQYCKNNLVEVIIYKIYLNSTEYINLVLIYSPPHNNNNNYPHKYTDNDFWDSILDFSNSLENIVLCGDFNPIQRKN